MIAHLVLFKLKPGVSKTDPRMAAVIAAMNGLAEQIAWIRGWEHGPNQTEDSLAWDFMACARYSTTNTICMPISSTRNIYSCCGSGRR